MNMHYVGHGSDEVAERVEKLISLTTPHLLR